jgi:hypothetical protein
MVQVHDRYSKTFAAMRDETAVINWRALTALNVEGYVKDEPGVFLLAHQSPHDANRVKPPYYFGSAGDLQAELAKQVEPSDPELAAQALRGNRWFRVAYGTPENLDQQLAELKDKWAALAKEYADHLHASPALEHRGDDAGQHS